MNFTELEKLVIEWAEEKSILKNGTPLAQAEKTIEEANEIKTAILNGDKAEIIDGIGDTLVTVIIQAEMQGLKLTDCLESAYNVIKNRTGYMKDGQFYKNNY